MKDTVFTSLFRDKGYLLQLYQALLFKDKLIFLVEAQSIWTVNILVRVILYLAKSYQDYIIRTGQDIYGSKRVVLPKPEVYVIYTGSRKAKPETISFAEEFFPGEECGIDVAVHMVYDGEGRYY